MTTYLSVADLIAAGSLTEAVDRMQSLCAIRYATPVDVDAVRTHYEDMKAKLRAVTPPPPFRIYVDVVKA